MTTVINPDGMPTSDLVRLVADKSIDQRLRNYATCLIQARQYRLTGLVDAALSWEGKAYRIYDALPDSLRW